jgi:adenosylcobinamide kinase/adenosylcobinamide-phosphate guanylyltransferase
MDDPFAARKESLMPIILVGGGSRSGKSSYALQLARKHGQRLGYIATAQACDEEMTDRIRFHREERGAEFSTFEEPLDIVRVFRENESSFDAVIIDCLTLWLSNHLLLGREPPAGELLDTAAGSAVTSILVTNEVGCGIVPDNALARRFRDLAGWLNQQAAGRAIEVYWTAFGVPLRLK